MSRLRALLALLLAVTWCSATWHVGLETLGFLLEHKHHVHHDIGHHADHGPASVTDEHDDVFARNVTQDQPRLILSPGLWLAVVACVSAFIAVRPPTLASLRTRRRWRETDPPFQQSWQFLQRCAALPAAPPAFR